MTTSSTNRFRYWWRGLSSMFAALLHPFGSWWCRDISHLKSEERLERGCVFVLPGIQGKSPVEFGVARGLEDAGVNIAIEVFDWTTGFSPFFLLHLRLASLHRRAIDKLTRRLVQYSQDYPGKPIHIIGHSGGGGIAMLTASQLPDDLQLETVTLLGAAVSSRFPVENALNNIRRGLWNVSSRRDFTLLVIGTTIAGTIDGRHSAAAGALGFRESHDRLIEIPFRWQMARSWNFGGHFGYVNRVFIAGWVAPIINDQSIESRN